jgi:hypothetical protein
MFSVMRTGTNRRPSWTAIVMLTMSGMIIDARDQVRITSRVPWAAVTFFISLGSTNGPFLIDLLIPVLSYRQANAGTGA